MWKRDSVKYINTYRVDLTTPEGQKFMFDQCEIYFGLKEGRMADTAFVPADPSASSAGDAGTTAGRASDEEG